MNEKNEFREPKFFYIYKCRTSPNILNKARPSLEVKLSPATLFFRRVR